MVSSASRASLTALNKWPVSPEFRAHCTAYPALFYCFKYNCVAVPQFSSCVSGVSMVTEHVALFRAAVLF
jgi:hypothetical protein